MIGVEIEFKFPEWAKKVKARESELNLFMAANIQFNRGMLFDNEGAYNGRQKWASLKMRSGMILSRRGTLRKSIAPSNASGQPGTDGIVRFSGDTITVGTKILYARLMNDGTEKMPGGVMRPVRAKALKIPLPQGQHANAETKKRAKEAGARQAQARANELRRLIDNAQTPASEAKYREQLRKLEKRIAAGDTGEAKFIFVKYVRIPARPFDTWNDEDQAEIDAALLSKVTEIMNSGTN